MATEAQVKDFISRIAPIIVKEAKGRGYNYPSAIIAQACCESAYGTSSLGYKYNNFFGMKCGSSWKGGSVNLSTKEEYSPGTLTSIRDNFRTYRSMEEGVKGYFDFISMSRYSNLKQAISSRDYIEKIKSDGYATSSSYVTTVYGIVTKYGLDVYDRDQIIKPVDPEIVRDVLTGKLGNGEARKQAVKERGYVYEEVQRKVNEIITISETLYHIKKQLGDYYPIALEQIK